MNAPAQGTPEYARAVEYYRRPRSPDTPVLWACAAAVIALLALLIGGI